MQIAILADESYKALWNRRTIPQGIEILWCGSVKTLVATVADVYIDLLFTHDCERSKDLAMRADFPFFVNCVETTSSEIGEQFIRINAWPGFLERPVIELVATNENQKKRAEDFFQKLQWDFRFAPDLPGMISARIIAAIINEAFYTYGEEVSSQEDIDMAMKLGTNYPYGPFEWTEQIGLERVYSLLKELARTDSRYAIAPALEKEMLQRHSQ